MNAKWIDVYDNLPEDEDIVIVAWRFNKEDENHKNVYPHFYGLGSYFDMTQRWCFSEEHIEDNKDNIEVLAWMPLPDFYEV